MLKETITYIDYFGLERTEDFYFHLTEAELMKMQLSSYGGLAEQLQAIINAKDAPTIMKIFEDIILTAYGVKSEDGRRFMKSEEIKNSFKETEAYSQLFMKLSTDADAAAKFINGIIPADKQQAAAIAAAK